MKFLFIPTFVASIYRVILRTTHDGVPNPFGARSAPVPTPIPFVACCASCVLTPLWSGLLLALALLRSRSSVDHRGALFSLGFAQVFFGRATRITSDTPFVVVTDDRCAHCRLYICVCFLLCRRIISILSTQRLDSQRRIRRATLYSKGTITRRPG